MCDTTKDWHLHNVGYMSCLLCCFVSCVVFYVAFYVVLCVAGSLLHILDHEESL